MKKTIYFDLDGVLVDFYGVNGWLDYILASDPTPYKKAKPLVNMSILARYIHKAQTKGYEVGVISWLAKDATVEYDNAVTKAKLEWLETHLPSVEFDQISIVKYGTPKSLFAKGEAILFDDEEPNRNEWKGQAYDQTEIINILKALV